MPKYPSKAYEHSCRWRKNNRERYNKFRRDAYNANPMKFRARQTVNRAVRWGNIRKPKKCPRCGASGVRIEAHHKDYAKPLDVQWLCFKCHKQEHKCPTVVKRKAAQC